MSNVIRQETAVFLMFVLHGAVLTLFYDFLRALRRNFRHNLAVLSAEDFFFWILAGFLTFWLAFRKTDGVLRGYIAAGILLGFLLYHLILGNLAVCFLSAVLRLVWMTLSFPGRAGKVFVKKIVKKFCKNRKKRIEFARKRGYNVKHRQRDDIQELQKNKTGS